MPTNTLQATSLAPTTRSRAKEEDDRLSWDDDGEEEAEDRASSELNGLGDDSFLQEGGEAEVVITQGEEAEDAATDEAECTSYTVNSQKMRHRSLSLIQSPGTPASPTTTTTTPSTATTPLASPSSSSPFPPVSPRGSSASNLRVSVCVRKRPMMEKESRQREKDIVLPGKRANNMLEVHEPKVKVDMTKYTDVHVFEFDHYFSDLDDNLKVYEEAVRPLVSNIFKMGARVTCFCYGQTGSGKTHTMMGKRGEDGLYALAAKDIFSLLEVERSSSPLSVSVALFEIYGNKLFDLLNDKKQIVARQNSKQQVCVVGLKEHNVDSFDGLLQMIGKGNASRSTSATGVHSESSRSHAILQISLKGAENKTRGMFSFIDLAGSEKAGDTTENKKQTRLEGAEINKSLLALKECIRALDRSQKHAPFRQSTLTQVLKDSFMGPHSRTIMIANIAPNSGSAEHTLNTLRYADRVRELRANNATFSPATSSSPSMNTSPTPSTPISIGSRRPADDAQQPSTPRDEDITKWHRQHLESLTRLVERERSLLEIVERCELRGKAYRTELNDILLDQALLFSNVPKNLG